MSLWLQNTKPGGIWAFRICPEGRVVLANLPSDRQLLGCHRLTITQRKIDYSRKHRTNSPCLLGGWKELPCHQLWLSPNTICAVSVLMSGLVTAGFWDTWSPPAAQMQLLSRAASHERWGHQCWSSLGAELQCRHLRDLRLDYARKHWDKRSAESLSPSGVLHHSAAALLLLLMLL